MGLGTIAVGAVMAALGYFGRRFVEKSGSIESIERAGKLVTLHEDMQRLGLSVSDLNSLEEQFFTRRPRLRKIEDAIALEVREDGRMAFETQADMNANAGAAWKRSEEALNEVLARLKEILPADEFDEFWHVQEQWKAYSLLQAELYGKLFEGGSMRPMIVAGELERMTIQRTAELRDYLNMKNGL